MKTALIINTVTHDITRNLVMIKQMAHMAADEGAYLVIFPETAITGLINNDDPAHDWCLGQLIPGPFTDELAQLARQRGLWLAIGLLERDHARLYDSAVLLSPTGAIALKYRRIHPGWHGRHADPSFYGHGVDFTTAMTPFGKVAFSICGEYFDDDLARRLHEAKLDLLLNPMARCFPEGSYDQMRWDDEELPAYAERVRLIGCVTLTTNYLADRDINGGAFGGATMISGRGTVLAQWPLGRPGMLMVDLVQVQNG